MFNELLDYISLWFSWRWPKADGVITAAYLDTASRDAQARVAYEFSVGEGGHIPENLHGLAIPYI